MALDLGTVTSAVVLRDAFSGVLDKVIESIDQFQTAAAKAFPSAAQFAEDIAPAFNLAAVAVAATTAAVVGLVSATAALAERGADVLDVAGTLEHFSGSAAEANDNLQALRKGTQDTVDDMALMRDASRILSAGVKLNADDFGTLGEAAFVLQNRGLGGTKEMLDLVSDAMITGRTKALAMKLGVIDLGDAHANYAKQLGIDVNLLSDAGKAEAARLQIMKMLKTAVADAGVQEKDFGEIIETAHTAFSNWLDDLGVAIAQSPVFTTAVHEIGTALATAFDTNQANLLKDLVHWIEQGLILSTEFGIGVVEAARVTHTAWEGMKVAAEGLAVGIGLILSVTSNAVANILRIAASMPLATQGMKDAAAEAAGFRDSVEDLTIGMIGNVREAVLATAGYDSLNTRLDKAGGFLFSLKDSLEQAAKNQRDHTAAVNDHTGATDKGTKANDDNARSMVDQDKAQKLRDKGLADAMKLWGEYNELVTSASGTSFDAQIAAVERWKTDLINAHKEAHTDTVEFYAAVEAVASQKLKMIGSDWDNLRDQSRESLKAQADAAGRDYQRMRESGKTFGDALDAQLKKWMDLQDAAAGFGQKGKDAMDKTAKATQEATDKVRTLAGELISVAEAERRRAQGGSQEVTSQNFETALQNKATSGGWNPSGQGSNIDMVEAHNLASKGYSFQEIMDIFERKKTGGGPIPPPHGPRIPGFAGGGVVMVGEQGPELVALPNGSEVHPGGIGDTHVYHITNYINGTGDQVARDFSERLLTQQKLRGQMPKRR